VLPPIGHHDFGCHDRQEENYERRRSIDGDIYFSLPTTLFYFLVMGK
jgi:hypothetical protein